MGKIKRYRNIIERFLSGEKGQRFFNFAYSIGAAIVIWGALFKILYLPGGNTLLAIGMGTEVLMFILNAFDNPYRDNTRDMQPVAAVATVQSATTEGIQVESGQLHNTVAELASASETLAKTCGNIADDTAAISAGSKDYAEQMDALNRNVAALNAIYELQLKSISAQLESIERVNRGMKHMREIGDNASAMSCRYSEEAEKLTHNIERLNAVYENMLRAMTINMQPADGIK